MRCRGANIPDVPALFRFEAVTVRGEERPRVEDLSFDVPTAALTVVVGPSGSGKSTVLRLANRLVAPDCGRVLYQRRALSGVDVPDHRRKVAMVFQQAVTFTGSVLENLRIADRDLHADAARRLLGRVHLDPTLLERSAGTLSGGEAQRMCLARALATHPDVLLLDEPTSGLDPAPRLALEQLARELRDEGLDVIWVTHDLAQMERLADGVVVIIGGRVAHQSAARPFVSGAQGSALEFLESQP